MAGEPPERRIFSTPKEGERILAPTRRPDGTLRKPIRIRAGYVPPDEIGIYQPKGVLLRKENDSDEYDRELAATPKIKSAKRIEKQKEKQLEATFDETKESKTEEVASSDMKREHSVEVVTEQLSRTSVSASPEVVSPSTGTKEIPEPETSSLNLYRKIRALKKKIRLAEAKLQDNKQRTESELAEKLQKIEGWSKELKLLEASNAGVAP